MCKNGFYNRVDEEKINAFVILYDRLVVTWRVCFWKHFKAPKLLWLNKLKLNQLKSTPYSLF
ncbi:hypothetical protein CK503_06660 [Aliifodinibius salipaludis]|uniref:Uncharacterized protein n=1 Tax=Fodinibius salipaludis TaxID=2032627 RepID=A0A2A2GBW4_9BACT|nr:hypothetical protein CK503_06660 [Aliifodinibius salipaludis]